MSDRFDGRERPSRVWASAFARLGGSAVARYASGCGTRPAAEPIRPVAAVQTGPFERLSQYQLFDGDPLTQRPAAGVIPYDLNSALFSDYAEKYRFLKLPSGTHATFSPDEVFEFPVGTVIRAQEPLPSRATPVIRRKGAG